MGINISEANQFIGLHAHPQGVNSNDLKLINDWVVKYPYCQTLHILATTVYKQDATNQDYLTKAATFAANREVLFQFINHIEDFETQQVILDEAINEGFVVEEIIEPKNDMGQAFGADLNYYKIDEESKGLKETEEEPRALSPENVEQERPGEKQIQIEEPILDSVEEQVDVATAEEEQEVKEIQTEEEVAHAQENDEENEAEENFVEEVSKEEEIQIEEPILDNVKTESAVATAEEEEEIQTEEEVAHLQGINEENEVGENFEEEVSKEEEVQIEEPILYNVEEQVDVTTAEEEEEIQTEEEVAHAQENDEENEVEESLVAQEKSETKSDEKDELVFESPIASDFFAFAKVEQPNPSQQAAANTKDKSKEEISQYNDERMPYTFLWWLNKTRKEHAHNLQPYVKSAPSSGKVARATTDQSLNHQIAENIFHLTGAEEIAKTAAPNKTVPFDFRSKEFQIIEKFIKEEPQIKHPAPNKIDSENKAKKSSEDANQVVSETLAKIYVDQMLYHKALDVYKKLSLKYPEKSTYFASQIKYLELKVN
ncbi:MAG TPA: hypothetical protein VF273_01730 [Pelobium sp.]